MNESCRSSGCENKANIGDREGWWCRPHWDEREAAKHAEERQATIDAGGPWPQTCPRRFSDLGPWEREEGLDTWDIREQMHHGLRARHCSFCGSLHPDDFMERVEQGWLVGPTDKNYKAYLGPNEGSSQETKFYYQHFSEAQQDRFIELYNNKVRGQEPAMAIGYPGNFYRFPFFMRRAEARNPGVVRHE